MVLSAADYQITTAQKKRRLDSPTRLRTVIGLFVQQLISFQGVTIRTFGSQKSENI